MFMVLGVFLINLFPGMFIVMLCCKELYHELMLNFVK